MADPQLPENWQHISDVLERIILSLLISDERTTTELDPKMNLNDLYPSNWLKAADLQGKTVTATIREVKVEELGRDNEKKPVMYFVGSEKGLVLNKTNATTIGNHYGPHIPGWYGKQITLFSTWVDFQGRSTQSIRVSVPGHQPESKQTIEPEQVVQAVAAQPPSGGYNDLDDEIPF